MFLTIVAIVIVAVLVVYFAITAKVKCSHCGSNMRCHKMAIPSQCERCYNYSRLENGKAVPIPKGFVYMSPIFKVEMDRLRDPALWGLPSPEHCCVCGGPAVRTQELEAETRQVVDEFLTMQTHRVRTFKFAIGCCASCKEPFDNAYFNSYRPVQFRSYDFFRAFFEANKKTSSSASDGASS